jgi:integrase
VVGYARLVENHGCVGADAQVQRWLGHHSASFTLDTYVHLLDNDLGEPLHAAAPLPSGAS